MKCKVVQQKNAIYPQKRIVNCRYVQSRGFSLFDGNDLLDVALDDVFLFDSEGSQ